jgi:hypothetical protein
MFQWKKITQNVAQPIFCKISFKTLCKKFGYLCIFKFVTSKKSFEWRKFAKSGTNGMIFKTFSPKNWLFCQVLLFGAKIGS